MRLSAKIQPSSKALVLLAAGFWLGLPGTATIAQNDTLPVLAPESEGCPTAAQESPSSDPDCLPAAAIGTTLQPLARRFGYDPELAARRYGHELHFFNLDPASFDRRTAVGRQAFAGLAAMMTHVTLDLSYPLWARLSQDTQTLSDGLRDVGYLPSPFRLQLAGSAGFDLAVEGTVPYAAETIRRNVQIPYSLALSQAAYSVREEDERGAPRDNHYTAINCLMCHGGVYGDHVIAGAANKNFSPEQMMRNIETSALGPFTKIWPYTSPVVKRTLFSSAWLKRAGLDLGGPTRLLLSDSEGEMLKNLGLYQKAVTRRLFSTTTNQTVGATSSTWFVFSSIAHLKPNATTLDDWASLSDAAAPTANFGKLLARNSSDGQTYFSLVKARAWWLGRYSGNHFWLGWTPEGPDHSAGDLAVFLATPGHGDWHTPPMSDRHKISLALQSFIHETKGPAFPAPDGIDWPKATAGAKVYSDACATCHGQLTAVTSRSGIWKTLATPRPLTEQSHWRLDYAQNRARVPQGKVQTDDLYWRQLVASRDIVDSALHNGEAKSFRLAINSPRPGDEPYMNAPPLISVWASAPYLHNGSVPTLYALLNSSARPTVWKMDQNPYAYDYDMVGVVFEEVPRVPARQQVPSDLLYYDTTLSRSGMTNGGHTFGDALTDDERFEVIEFLKTLDSSHVEPAPAAWAAR